jgi:hypothetical protein
MENIEDMCVSPQFCIIFWLSLRSPCISTSQQGMLCHTFQPKSTYCVFACLYLAMMLVTILDWTVTTTRALSDLAYSYALGHLPPEDIARPFIPLFAYPSACAQTDTP